MTHEELLNRVTLRVAQFPKTGNKLQKLDSPLTLLSMPETLHSGKTPLYSDYFGCFCKGFDS